MKKLFLVIGVLFSFISVSAQQADMRIGELINKSDWFSLEKEFPQLKDSVQTKFLKLLAEIMIDNNFNRPEEALKNINELLTNHQQEMAFGNTCNMVSLSAIIDGQRGNYAQAADKIKSFTEQLKSLGVAMDFTSYEVLYNNYNELREYPAPSISRPIKDIEIPVAIEPVKLLKPIDGETSRGLKIDIPVTIHNKQYKFIFDTGAASTYMSERFAKEVGVKIIADSVLLNEGMMGEGFGFIRTKEVVRAPSVSFFIGKTPIEMKDIRVHPIADNEQTQEDGNLGMDLIKQSDRTIINLQDMFVSFE